MEKLVSNWYNVRALPGDYIFPQESRPGNLKIPFSSNIPVIDLSEAEKGDSIHTIQKIIKAAEEFGFFQVINHGISVKLMNETRSVMKELFQMPAECNQKLYSDDPLKPCSPNYATEEVRLWQDNFRHPCHPLEEWQDLWPENPTSYRLITEGRGLECEYFENDLSGSMLLSANHYPLRPEPSLTLGVPKHSDPNIITILLQDDVCGLQAFHNGKWMAIKPLRDAFMVNIGYQLQGLVPITSK